MPERIQMSRQRPWRAEHPTAIIVDRNTVYGNPFKIGIRTSTDRGEIIVTNAQQAVDLYREWMLGKVRIAKMPPQIGYLRGQDLACWCAPDAPCHADVLLEVANA